MPDGPSHPTEPTGPSSPVVETDSIGDALEHLPADMQESREDALKETMMTEVRERLAANDAPVVLANIDKIIATCGQETFLTAFLDADDTVRDGRLNLLRSPAFKSKFSDDMYAKFLEYGAPKVEDTDKQSVNPQNVEHILRSKAKDLARQEEQNARDELRRQSEPLPDPEPSWVDGMTDR
jgi:hypothetical protein